jgi:metal-dependent amidase/aminoacylase/carboxypeptidase family protein
MLLSFGVEQKSISEYSREGHRPTGLIVDLRGEAEPKGKDYFVAFRADMDALAMEEDNPHLPYASKHKGAAHMCGHDGHTACLLGFAQLFIKKLP